MKTRKSAKQTKREN